MAIVCARLDSLMMHGEDSGASEKASLTPDATLLRAFRDCMGKFSRRLLMYDE